MFKKKTIQPRRQRAAGTSNAPSVFSYHASRAASTTNLGRGKNSQEGATKLRRPKFLWARRTSHLLILLLVGALCISNLLLASVPKIVVIGDEDKNQHFLRDTATYQASAQRIFASSIFNTNKLTVDIAQIKRALTTQFPEFADVSVSLPLIGRQPVIYIQPSTSRLILSTQQGESYVLDGTGKAIASSEKAASLREVGLPVVQDQSGLDVELGSTAMPSTSVAFITEVARQLKVKNIGVGSMILPAGTNELHLQVKDMPYSVKFNLEGEAREEAGAFLATKARLDSEKKVPTQYIDVRVQNRVYYQ